MVSTQRIIARIPAVSRDRRGVAAAEFALVATAMIILLLGGFDVANVVQIRLQLQQALRAGGQYALAFPTQTSGITSAIQQALPASWTDVTPSATAPLTGASSCPPPLTTSPPSGPGSPPYYITLCASRPYSPFLILGPTIQNTASYVVRVQ